MSDVTISVIQQPSTIINVGVDETLAIGTSMSSTTVNVGVDETTLIQAGTSITPHSFTHVSGGNDEINHNLLNGLQGGSNNQYYHISSAQYFNLATGDVVRPSQTGAFYPRSNPSGYITGINNIVYTVGSQIIDGIKTFSHLPLVNGTGVVLTSETGQFYPRSNPSGYISNANNILFITGNQTISGVKTFVTGLVIQSTTNQLTLRTGSAGNSISITAPTINANRIYTLPDVGVAASFLLTAGVQTISSLKNFTVRPTVNTTGVALVSEITNLVYTTGDQKVSGIKTFGENNNIYNSAHSHILGGEVNIISGVTGSGLDVGNVTSYTGCFIGGGNKNDIISANYSIIGGGQNNHISGVTGTGVLGNVFIDRVFYSTIVGGLRNDIFKNYGSIAGGQDNTISGDHSFIGAGRFNSGFGDYSVIVGGDKNLIESNVDFGSILGGRRALINSNHNGATILTDGQDRDHISKGSHTCSLDFASGVYLRLPSFTGIKNQTGNFGELKISGEYLYIATGQNTWGRIQISTF